MAPDTFTQQLFPFLIEPRFVPRVWGYTDLHPWYDLIAASEPTGEVWLTGDECRVATGVHAGKTLVTLFREQPLALLGRPASGAPSPLLVKVIFAREKLSVQVHPDDRLAQKYGQPNGKTECWFALDAQPGAQVTVGLKPGVTFDKIKAGIHDGTLEQSLNILPVSVNDMFLVDAGTVHAIWPGSILLETQQNSDITYRLYDYGRPRELHIEKSLEATRLVTRAGKVPPHALSDRTILIDVEYFRVERIPIGGLRDSASLPAGDEPAPNLSYLFAAAGSARITSPSFDPIEIPPRNIACIPAVSPGFIIEGRGGLDLVRISPRFPAASFSPAR